MIYIINKTAVFSSELKKLSLYLDSESYVILSNQAARLIVELIQNNGITLSREHLLKHVWEDYGSTPSNNNLYMAISELRKAFRLLGMNDKIISTIPKTGFLFEGDIDVSQESLQPTMTIAERPEPVMTSFSQRVKPWKMMILIGVILTAAVLALSSILFHAYVRNPLKMNTNHLNPHFSLGKCTFFALGKQSEEGRKWVTSFVQTEQVRSMLRIDCDSNQTAVYYRKLPPPVNETFLAACTGKTSPTSEKCKILRAEND
ncbi:putative membrane protein [Enterobacter sp. J49]|uniref:winged helix-turn-helix domain-containing protein n=1 Tax=Enterobacter sp. J49 TaxID=1903627 RepID=UPI000A39ECB5|nr:winged helix-turn-helix domain-containing protein [Enterobacter sp. J49]OUC37001.1 putative membrane protein [Enterobacter sp. J49]